MLASPISLSSLGGEGEKPTSARSREGEVRGRVLRMRYGKARERIGREIGKESFVSVSWCERGKLLSDSTGGKKKGRKGEIREKKLRGGGGGVGLFLQRKSHSLVRALEKGKRSESLSSEGHIREEGKYTAEREREEKTRKKG